MEQEYLDSNAVHAYLELVALNMRVWRPEVAEWLHSEDAEGPLLELLSAVPCSPTIH
jgi:hypothetical protein